jgi:hypothetical protein
MLEAKIKITDNSDLRKQLVELYLVNSQIIMAKWSLILAKHILEIAGINYENNPIVMEGIRVNEAWQKGEARMHDIRQAGFKIHKLARESETELVKTAYRVVGQAVGSGHMKEHSLVAADYAIKFINLLHKNDLERARSERLWQIENLKQLISCSN